MCGRRQSSMLVVFLPLLSASSLQCYLQKLQSSLDSASHNGRIKPSYSRQEVKIHLRNLTCIGLAVECKLSLYPGNTYREGILWLNSVRKAIKYKILSCHDLWFAAPFSAHCDDNFKLHLEEPLGQARSVIREHKTFSSDCAPTHTPHQAVQPEF